MSYMEQMLMMMAIKFFIILYFKDNDVTFNIICYPTSHANLRSKWGMKRNPRFITSLSFYMPRSDLTYSWWTLLFTVIQLKSQVSSPDRKLGEDEVNWLFFFFSSQLRQWWAHSPTERCRRLYWARWCTGNNNIKHYHITIHTKFSLPRTI